MHAALRGFLLVAMVFATCVGAARAQSAEPDPCNAFRVEWRSVSQTRNLAVAREFWARVPLQCVALKEEVRQAVATLDGSRSSGDPNSRSVHADRARSSQVEVRGFVLAREQDVPADAVAYAIAVFTERQQALRFCPAFLNRLTFEGRLTPESELRLRYAGRDVEVVPFAWPVTNWEGVGFSPSCDLLVDRYDYGRARDFLRVARAQLEDRTGAANLVLSERAGPFIVIARRIGGSLVVYDLSMAPEVDYDRWLVQTIAGLEGENSGIMAGGVITPGVRDRLRFVVFSAIPSVRSALADFVPGFARME